MKLFLHLLLITLFPLLAVSQTIEQKKELIKDYDLEKLDELAKRFKTEAEFEKQKALVLANQNGWIIRQDIDGVLYELMGITEEGTPLYFTTENVDAATSTRAYTLHNGSLLGLNVEGQNMTSHVWDGGLARSTHQEYDGIGGSNRFSIGDGTTALHYHSAHVTGTIIASGFVAQAKGMAPQAQAVGYDWNTDVSEATTAAGAGMLLSNHSYGWGASGIPDWYFGAYNYRSREWDVVMNNAPYYLMVCSAGNDGNDNSSNGDPLEGNSSYDKLSGFKTTKNNMVVANGQDANIDANGNLISVTINSGSSEGPTDDYRIKPDITGNGTGLYSSYESADNAYNSISGTSMASPNVNGTLLLLQQHYNNINSGFMLASTLKGLALHTADDIGPTGPDAVHGWGLLNAKEAANTITNAGNGAIISELSLSQGSTYQINVTSDGINDLIASISWNDPAGPENTGISNDNTPVLVNDLDIRITQGGTTYYPYKLTSVSTNTTGDNLVDPYERINAAGASGNYTITVSHKGSLSGGGQDYALIVTGSSLTNLTAEFVGSPTSVSTGGTVVYTDLSGGPNPITSYSWGFPGGTPASATGAGPHTITYNTAGTYNASLSVGDGSSTDVELKTNYIEVISCPINTLPWNEGFENVGPTTTFTADDSFINGLCNWSYDMVNAGGRLRFEAGSGFYHSGSKAATLDRNPSGGDNINYLITELDLSAYSSATDLELSFYYMHHGEESSANDRVWIRGSNTDTWIQIYDLFANQGTAGNWNNVTALDIDDVLINAVPSQSISSTFQIRFGQQDNFPATSTTASDGYTFDDIAISGSIAVSFTWTGALNTNWDEQSNWSGNTVPISTSNVIIPVSAPLWPVKTGNLNLGTDCNRIDMNGSSELTVTGDLTISTGKLLNCVSNALIKVGGDWTNQGAFNKGIGTVEFYGTTAATIAGGAGGSSDITQYAVSTFPVGMTNVTGGSAGPTGDDGTLDVGIGFTFNYNGVDYTQARINTNGWVSLNLSGSTGTFTNSYLFDGTEPNTTLAPWWDDLNATGGALYYKTEGSSPNQVFIVEWNGVLTYYTGASATLDFQLRLYETSNIIEFHYGSVGAGAHSGSESASIGIEDATGGSNHFVEATTQSNTVGVTNLVSPADWPAINYRFTYSPLASVNSLHNLIISKNNVAVQNDADLDLSGNFDVKPDAWFTNGTANSINVSGNLLLEANATGMASYLDEGTTAVSGQTIVEQYLTSERWHQVSPPVSGATINTYFDIYLKEYNEPTDTWTYLIEPTTIPMNATQGYSAWTSDDYTGPTTVTFSGGTLTNSNIALSSLDYTPAAAKAGFNLIGNPYPCALDWNSNWSISNLSGWAVIYDNGTYKGWHPTSGSYNGKTDGIIPSTQGFWVRALNASATMTIPATERLHSGQAFYKETPENIYPELRLEMEINGHSDETVIIFHPEATAGFDGYYDLAKFDNVDEAPQLYTIQADGNYAVNIYGPDYQEKIIPVGFRTDGAGLFTIAASSIANFDGEIGIYLEDLKTATFTKLTDTPQYEFVYDPQDEDHRFNLHFTNQSLAIDEIAVNRILIYSSDHTVFIKNPELIKGDIIIYNMMGQEIYFGELNKEPILQISLDQGMGHYVVKVNTGASYYSEKVLIK